MVLVNPAEKPDAEEEIIAVHDSGPLLRKRAHHRQSAGAEPGRALSVDEKKVPQKQSRRTCSAAGGDFGDAGARNACEWCGSMYSCYCEEALVDLYGHVAVKCLQQGSQLPSSLGQSAEEIGVKPAEPEAELAASRPDFSGTWVFRRHEGDFEALMMDAGTPWAIRKMARAANFGAGMVTQVVQHSGDDLYVEFRAGTSTNIMKLRIGDGEQETIAEDGEAVRMEAFWDGDILILEGKKVSDGSPIQKTRRYMAGQEMVHETTTSKGEVIKRFYSP